MNTNALRLETTDIYDQYYQYLAKARELLIACKGEIRRLERTLKKIQDPREESQLQRKLDMLQNLKEYLEDAIDCARTYRRKGRIGDAVRELKGVVKNV